MLEDRRKILGTVIKDIMGRFDGTYRLLVNENRKLMDYLHEADFPMPTAFRLALHYVLDQDVQKVLEKFQEDGKTLVRLSAIQKEAKRFNIALDLLPLAKHVRQRVEGHLEALFVNVEPDRPARVLQLLDLAEELGLKIRLWQTENLFYELWNKRLKDTLDLAHPDRPDVKPFLDLLDRLRFKRHRENMLS